MGGIASPPVPNPTLRPIRLSSVSSTAINAIDGGAVVIWGVKVDCTSNSGENVFFKAVNAVTATPGTDDPDMVLKGIAGATKTYMFPESIDFFANMSVWCTQEKTTVGVTDPSGTVSVSLLVT